MIRSNGLIGKANVGCMRVSLEASTMYNATCCKV